LPPYAAVNASHLPSGEKCGSFSTAGDDVTLWFHGVGVTWLAAFDANVDKVRAQNFDHRFIRCWRFYLAYCAAGFASETTDVAQYTLVAP